MFMSFHDVHADSYVGLGESLAWELLRLHPEIRDDPDESGSVLLPLADDRWARVRLVPPVLEPQLANAAGFFAGVGSGDELLKAYQQAREATTLEDDLAIGDDRDVRENRQFWQRLLRREAGRLGDDEATAIARWVSHYDLYAAIKCVESMLHTRAARLLLQTATLQGWDIHLDHIAIGCGCSDRSDAERVVLMLTGHHGYAATQIPGETFYRFEDDWEAYLLYKRLNNGRLIRLSIYQSSRGHPQQFIRQWNRIFGYTAHHIALRATSTQDGPRQAVPLGRLAEILEQQGLGILEINGESSHGLLEQAFIRADPDADFSPELSSELAARDPDMAKVLARARHLELVSRREMPPDLARELTRLVGRHCREDMPCPSAPMFSYFLPEQTARVVRLAYDFHSLNSSSTCQRSL